MRIVIPPVKSEGSPRGLGYWLQYLNGCPKQRAYGGAASTAMDIGTLFHKLLELRYSGEIPGMDVALEYAENNDSPAWLEALRLFSGYHGHYGYDWFKDCVETTEEELRVEGDEALTVFGVPEFTGRIDMAIRIKDQKMADRIAEQRNLPMLEPGLYLVDHKTASRKSSNLAIEAQYNMQFKAYQILWERVKGEKPKGMIGNYVFRHKKLKPESFGSVMCMPPTEEDHLSLKRALWRAMVVRDTLGEDFANPTQCFSWGRPCQYLDVCDRK